MTLKNKAFLLYSKNFLKEIDRVRKSPQVTQIDTFNYLIENGCDTLFGYEHEFDSIKSIKDFTNKVPIRDYNAFAPYIELLRSGEKYVLWNQDVSWFAKSSGTSSDKSKFIPITPDSLYMNHYGGFKRMLASYINANPKSNIFNGKALTLGGSVVKEGVEQMGHYWTGDLSAILLSNSPAIAELHRVPKRNIALLSNFNMKTDMICESCLKENVTNFSGVPSWNLVLMNKILKYSGKSNILDIWPNMELFMHGGIGFAPYREIYKEIIPSDDMNYLENYNASEGYFAFQDDLNIDGMLLSTANGVFYEFIPMDKFDDVMSGVSDDVITIDDVKVGVNYAMVISTVGGLWRYLIGDCIKFVSLYPHRIKVTGRTQLYINAFGEELMIENAERALDIALKKFGYKVKDFTVAPHFMEYNKDGGAQKGFHKWAIEFYSEPDDLPLFEEYLDFALTQVNSDYEAKRRNNTTMMNLKITSLNEGTFYKWMENRNKVGGQNKVPRLYPDSTFFDELLKISDTING